MCMDEGRTPHGKVSHVFVLGIKDINDNNDENSY